MYNNYGNSYATLKMCHFSCQLFINVYHKILLIDILLLGFFKENIDGFRNTSS